MGENTKSFVGMETVSSPPEGECASEIGKPVILSSELLKLEGSVVTPLKDWGVGLDVHRDFVQVSAIVKDHDQCIEYRHEFPTDLDGIKTAHTWVLAVIRDKSFPSIDIKAEKLHYVVESTSSYHQIVLRTWKGVPSVINPALAGSTLSKTDVKDASRLAQMDLTGIWREFYIPSDDVTCLRVLISQRSNYGMLANRTSNQINSTFLTFGITIGRDGSVTRNAKIRKLGEKLISNEPIPIMDICPNGIPDPVKNALTEKYALFDEYISKRSDYEKQILAKAESMEWETGKDKLNGKKMLELLTTVPGVGPLTAVTWLANVITPNRFRSVKSCSAYCGLDPSVQVSAKHVTSRLVRKGNKDLHSALVQAASILIKNHSEQLGRWGYQLYLQTGRWKKATNAVARRLSVALFYVQLYGVPFSYDKYELLKTVPVIDIPIDELPSLIPEFQRYVKIMKQEQILTTAQLVSAYYSFKFTKVKGAGKKFYGLVKDFIDNQKMYRDRYRILHSECHEEGNNP